MGQLERDYQAGLIRRIRDMLPGCYVLKNDTAYVQGLPDLTVLYGNHWATLEVKRSAKAARQPNQEFYVEQMNDMSFSAFIHPENEQEVLNALKQAFSSRRSSRHA